MKAFAVSLVFFLAACAVQQTNTFSNDLAYAYGVHTAVLQATTAGLHAKSITVAQAEQILSQADKARVLLDSAKAIASVGNLNGAQGQLTIATQILVGLQTLLKEGAPPP